ncbi:MAG TPA: hypothetical protein VIN10_12585 [Bacteroidales bacterium]
MSSIFFNTLLKINLSHEYHADGLCNELNIIPTQSSRHLLNRFGIFFKNTNSGAVLLYESPDGSLGMKIPIENELKLTFQFSPTNPAFLNYTDADFSNEPLTVFYFNNLNPSINGQNHTILESKIVAPLNLETRLLKVKKINADAKFILVKNIKGESEKYYFDSQFDELKVNLSDFSPGKYTLEQFDSAHNKIGNTYTYYYSDEITAQNLTGIFELFIDENYDPANPLNFLFNFKSRPTFWRYKILKNSSTPPLNIDNINAATISVKHEPENPADEIIFKAAAGTDPIIIQSENTIKLKEKGYDKIRLKKNSEILISNMPNANVDTLQIDGINWLSDIYVYVYV